MGRARRPAGKKEVAEKQMEPLAMSDERKEEPEYDHSSGESSGSDTEQSDVS